MNRELRKGAVVGGALLIGVAWATTSNIVAVANRMRSTRPSVSSLDENARLRQQVKSLRQLVERHREELLAVDQENLKLKGGAK